MLRAAIAALICLGLAAPALAQPMGWSGDAGEADSGEGRRDRGQDGWSLGWYGVGIGPRYSHSRDEGYFSQSGRGPLVSNDRADYDYDRGYPYDHYSYGGGEAEPDHELASRGPECTTEWTHDRRDRQDVAVRVCRN